MKSLRVLNILIIVLCSFLVAPTGFAAWVWSPQTGWIGPSGAVQDTPAEQLTYAIGFFEQQEYDRAVKEFRKLLKAYKDAPEAPEAQYHLGRCEEEQGNHYKAFQEYRKTIQVYPSTTRFDEILEREYQIANYFLSGHKRKLFGIAAVLPARDKAIEIFQAIADDGPFSQHGELAQYKLGLAHAEFENYEESVAAFEQVISRYPKSELVDDARFQIAMASLKGTFNAEYDQAPTDLAIRELEVFTREHDGSELLEEAKARRIELIERRAEHEFHVGQFYEERMRPTSAMVFYKTIIDDYADTTWAGKAAGRIAAIGQAAKEAPPELSLP